MPLLDTLDFRNIFHDLEAIGFFELVLPFILVFALVFGILEKTRLFGRDTTTNAPRTNLNAVVGLIMGFYVITQPDVLEVINSLLPRVSLVLLAIVSFLLLFGFFIGQRQHQWSGGFLILDGIFVLFAVLWAFTAEDYGLDSNSFEDWLDDYGSAILIILAVFGLIALVIGGRRDSTGGKSLQDLLTGGYH